MEVHANDDGGSLASSILERCSMAAEEEGRTKARSRAEQREQEALGGV